MTGKDAAAPSLLLPHSNATDRLSTLRTNSAYARDVQTRADARKTAFISAPEPTVQMLLARDDLSKDSKWAAEKHAAEKAADNLRKALGSEARQSARREPTVWSTDSSLSLEALSVSRASTLRAKILPRRTGSYGPGPSGAFRRPRCSA